MVKLLVHYRKNGKENKRGSIMKNLSKSEEQELVNDGFAEYYEKEAEEEGEEVKKTEVIEEPKKEEIEEITEELTLEDIQKKTVDELEALAKDNNIKLEGKNQKEKAKELFNKLANNPEV
jgi:signal recognition particle subunit SEC65